MKTVFLFLSVPSYISDVLQTPYISALAEKYRVIVFLPERDDIDISRYTKHANITYRSIPEPRGKFWTLFDILLRNECITKFNDGVPVQWRNKRTTDRRRHALRKFSFLFPKRIFTPDLFTRIERFVVPHPERFYSYIQQYQPSLVLTAATGWYPFDAYALLCAKKFHIPSVAISFSWDNLTVYPRHIRKPDYLICWNRMNKNEAIDMHGYVPEQVFVSGIMRFDHYFKESDNMLSREAFLKSKGLDPKRKTVLYAAKTQGDFYKDFIRSFVSWSDAGVLREPLNLFVRIHPLDALESYQEFFDIPNVHIERAGTPIRYDIGKGQKIEMNAQDLLNMKHTLMHCDVCVNVTSTVTIEAMIYDKPVINIGFVPEFSDILDFDHYKPLLDKKAVLIAQSMDEVKEGINRYLAHPEYERKGRADIVEYMIKPTDGQSYQRNVDFLETILKNTP